MAMYVKIRDSELVYHLAKLVWVVLVLRKLLQITKYSNATLVYEDRGDVGFGRLYVCVMVTNIHY